MLDEKDKISWRSSVVSMAGISNSVQSSTKLDYDLELDSIEPDLQPELELNFD